MKALYEGIYGHFTAAGNDFYTAIGGRLYLGEAKEGATFPYCVYFSPSGAPDYWFDNNVFENFDIQFSLFSDAVSPVEVNTNYGYLTDLFDDAAITVSGYTVYEFERTFQQLMRDPGPARWHYVVQYDVSIYK